MLYNLGNSLLGGQAGLLLVEEQVNNSVSDKTPVFHCSSGKVVDSNLIHLGQREGNIEGVLEELEALGTEISGELALRLETGSSVDSDGDSEQVGLNIVELSDNEGNQVG